MFQDHPDYIKTHLNSRTSLPNVAGRHKYLRGPKVLRNPVLSRANLYFSPLPLSIPTRVFLNPPFRGLFQPFPPLPLRHWPTRQRVPYGITARGDSPGLTLDGRAVSTLRLCNPPNLPCPITFNDAGFGVFSIVIQRLALIRVLLRAVITCNDAEGCHR